MGATLEAANRTGARNRPLAEWGVALQPSLIRPREAGGRVRSLPCTPPSRKDISKATTMDRTESTVRNMLAAIEAPLYDVGVLSDRGMLPGLDGIPADAVLERLSLLKYRNARGSHIYIRPSGEHRYTALDDLSEISLAKLTG